MGVYTVSGNAFWVWKSTYLAVYTPGGPHSWESTLLGVYTVSINGFWVWKFTHLTPGGLHSWGSTLSPSTDVGFGSALTHPKEGLYRTLIRTSLIRE